jgi:hypothetical protein
MNNEPLFHSLRSLQNFIRTEFLGPDFQQMLANGQDIMLAHGSVSDALVNLIRQHGRFVIVNNNNDFVTPVSRAIEFLRQLILIINEVWSAYLLNIFDVVEKQGYEIFHSFLTRILITVSDILAELKDQPQLQNYQHLFL